MEKGELLAVRLRLLGSFGLAVDGESLDLPLQPRRVLALLAVSGGGLPRTTLAGQLWGECSSRTAGARLRTALWKIRQTAAEALVIRSGAVSVAPRVDVDLWQVRHWVQTSDNRRQSSECDVDLLRQDLLPDWDEDWLVMERERLRQERLHLLEQLGRAHSSSGRYADAIASSMAAVMIEPLRESSRRVLIEAYIGEGNLNEAVREFNGYRQLIKDELGFEPSETLSALVRPYTQATDREIPGPS